MGHHHHPRRGIGGITGGGKLWFRACASDVREPKSEPGVSYRNERVATVPWSIHVLKIDRSGKISLSSRPRKRQILLASAVSPSRLALFHPPWDAPSPA